MASWDVIIKNRRQQADARKKTAVFPSKRGEIFSRRKTKGVRFFDCGYVFDGFTYSLLPYSDPLSIVPIGDDGSNYTNTDFTVDDSNTAVRDGLVLAYDVTDWPSTFKRIDLNLTTAFPTDVYWNGTFRSLSTETDEWKNDVFYPPDDFDSRFAIRWNVGGEFVDVGALSGTKITAIYDPDAVAVTPSLGKSFDVYIMPAIGAYDGTTSFVQVGIPNHTHEDLMGAYTMLYPRDVYLDPLHPMYGDVPFPFGLSYINNLLGSNDLTAYNAAYYQMLYMAGIVDPVRARHLDITAGGGLVFSTITPSDMPDNTYWPVPPSMPIDSSPFQNSLINDFLLTSIVRLLAVIRKGGQSYYVWQQ